MKATTAFCFLLSGWALVRASNRREVHRNVISTILLCAVLLIAVASLLETFQGRSFGLDEWFVRDPESRATGQPPGRMSTGTAISFVLLSTGLFLVDYSGLSYLLSLAGMSLSFLVLIGFLYKAEALYTVKPFATFALHTAFGLFLLGLGTLTLRRGAGVFPLLRSPYADVARTRPLLAGALLLPPCFGLLCLAGQRAEWYPPEFTVGLMTVLLMLAGSMLLWWTSEAGGKVDTKRREAERQLNARTEELTKSNAALEQYAFAAIHDLQEPLRMIMTYSQMLGRADPRHAGHEHEFLQTLEASAQRMSQLVTDLLLHSRILTEQDEWSAPVDMNVVLREVISRLSPLIVDTNTQVSVGELPVIPGDFGQLAHLFQNLLDNAIKYRKTALALHVQISARADGRQWIFSVQDNGIGFSMEYAKQIFGIFKRLHGPEIPGTGMGLAIGARLVERQGGRIWVESEPAIGSTFYVALPAMIDP